MKLFFRTFGQGKPLIILHGLFGLSDNWVSVGRALSGRFHVIIPDARNHGQSPHSSVFDYPSMEEDLLSLTDDLGLSKVSIIGHSMGGKTAMFFTLHHPEKVHKLVVVDIGIRKYSHNQEHQQLIDIMSRIDPGKSGSRAEVEHELAKYISDIRLRKFLIKNLYWRTPKRLDWRLNLEAIRNNLIQIFDGVDVNRQYMGPVLFIRGGRSEYILQEEWPDIKTKFPGAVIQTIAYASHWVHADAPEEFVGIVSSFLDQ